MADTRDGLHAMWVCGRCVPSEVRQADALVGAGTGCQQYFSLSTGTLREDSKLPLWVWSWAI